MTITNGYTDLETLKAYADIEDSEDDNQLENSITAVSRAIDDITWRRFFAVSETRYYTPILSDYLEVDDLLSITALWPKTDEDGDRTYENDWATTDYDLMPLNATLDGAPYTWLETTPNGDYSFPKGLTKSVEIKGSFGYAASTPFAIAEACLLGSMRLFKRKDTVLGVSAAAALGQLQVLVTQLKADPDFMMLVTPYIRRW